MARKGKKAPAKKARKVKPTKVAKSKVAKHARRTKTKRKAKLETRVAITNGGGQVGPGTELV